METKTAVVALAALAQESRLSVFRLLVEAGPAGVSAGKIAEALGMAPSSLSFHLKELMHAGLVAQERDGRNLIYRPAIDQMTALLDYLSAHCCQGQSCSPQAARTKRSAC